MSEVQAKKCLFRAITFDTSKDPNQQAKRDNIKEYSNWDEFFDDLFQLTHKEEKDHE